MKNLKLNVVALLMAASIPMFLIFSSFTNRPISYDYGKIGSPLLVAKDSVSLDTVFIFDPVTKKETIKIVERTSNEISTPTPTLEKPKTGIDTIIVFDPVTRKETITIINHDKGTKRTLK